MAVMSIFMPMVATRMYKNRLPMVEAPAPSILRARVKESPSPMVVAITTIQKKLEVRLYLASAG